MPTPKAQEVKLSKKEQQELEKLVSKHQTGQQIALRARIILAANAGQTNTAIAQKYEVKHDTVKLWRGAAAPLDQVTRPRIGGCECRTGFVGCTSSRSARPDYG